MADDSAHDEITRDTAGRRPGFTPPKGRPTRARGDTGARRSAFGPVAQWVTVAVFVLLVVVVLVLVTDGGDFNPFDDDEQRPSEFGAVSEHVHGGGPTIT